MNYIDIHCHLNCPEFDLDRAEAISRAQAKGVGMINVGTNIEDSHQAVKIAEENENTYKNIWAVIGLHPTEIQKELDGGHHDFENYRKLAQHPKVVAIGECGLDYFRDSFKNKEQQIEFFERQIALANEVKKPLMLHIRSGTDPEHNAYRDALEILKKHAKVHGDVHFFAGSVEEAHQFIKLGFRLSFTGVITFTRDYDEVIKSIPLNMILSETDCPFVTPVPYRGERNEPVYVIEVAHKIAEIRGEASEKVLAQLVENAVKLWKL